MNEYAVGRASADLRDAILKCMGLDVPIRMHGPNKRASKPKVVKVQPPRTTYMVPRPKRVEAIQELVAQFYGMTVEQLTGKRGSAEVSNARQVAMYLSREMANQSFPIIGWMFKRDHTTVMHACEVVEQRMGADPDYAGKIDILIDQLDPMAMAA